tara:strand:+ start:261 stop:446 length:186 start_codon:yes stop_codon:yes gene_type:complete
MLQYAHYLLCWVIYSLTRSQYSIELDVDDAMLEEVIEETIMESNAIVKAIEHAIEEHRSEV